MGCLLMPLITWCLQNTSSINYYDYILKFMLEILKAALGIALYGLLTRFFKPLDTFKHGFGILLLLLSWIAIDFKRDMWAIVFVSSSIGIYHDTQDQFIISSLVTYFNVMLSIITLSVALGELSKAMPVFN
jgi:hypothetical protein